eukprot:TRINITY_DN16724_c1_g1_i1.p1 TRINITY_DN16724_c1_g1~~TRINITY_DN16724_c1_g1_i1.p1  ORF type:complete len:268 (+),score=100.44 TRINITY_DN16724_c1_g1_i1:52-855(+)
MNYIKPKGEKELREAFNELVKKDIADQQEFFLKSFIFALGDDWKEVPKLAGIFRKYVSECGEGREDLNEIQASDFLQKNGITRTAIQRKNELSDIDLDQNKRIAFIEYMLLHFKVMILKEYYKRLDKTPPMKLDNETSAVGLVGVGDQLLDELFTLPIGLPPELVEAIEKFTETVRTKENRLKDLREKSKQGGVKGMTAQNEIVQMEKEDKTDLNRLELTLNAAKKKAAKNTGEQALNEKKKQEEEEKKQKELESKNRLKEKAKLWN